jgi:hypothetical protein
MWSAQLPFLEAVPYYSLPAVPGVVAAAPHLARRPACCGLPPGVLALAFA